MRIALIAPLVTTIAQPYVGGAQAMVADLAQGLLHRGHDVTLFARTGSAVPGVHVEPLDVPDDVLPSQFSSAAQRGQAQDSGFITQLNIFFELYLQLRRSTSFDLVHAHAFDYPSFSYSTLVTNVPVLHTVHLPAISPEINGVLALLERQGHPLHLVTVSHACARDYRPYTTFDRVIYNGLDVAAIPFVAEVPDDAPLLFAGRIAPEKGVVEAIEIAERSGRRLTLAGGIYDRRYYQEEVVPCLKRAGNRVSYIGQLEHETLWRLMGESSALLFPITWDEPFGLTPVEAMAAGTPVVAFRRGAAPEIIQHGSTGFLVDAGAIQNAAAAVAKVDRLDRYACRRSVVARFSLDTMLDAYEDYYRFLCQQS